MSDERTEIVSRNFRTQRIKIEQHSVSGGLWFGAWLFTLGFLKLSFWQGVLAIILWPYYLGAYFAATGPIGALA